MPTVMLAHADGKKPWQHLRALHTVVNVLDTDHPHFMNVETDPERLHNLPMVTQPVRIVKS